MIEINNFYVSQFIAYCFKENNVIIFQLIGFCFSLFCIKFRENTLIFDSIKIFCRDIGQVKTGWIFSGPLS